MKQRIFCDLDGVIAAFNTNASLEDLFTPGYFFKLPPMPQMVNAIKELAKDPDFDVYILSHVLSTQAASDKAAWLNQYLPELNSRHIFVPYGSSKNDFIQGGVLYSDVLLDDFTPNLKAWDGIPIKVLNGINFTNKTWSGHMVLGLADWPIITTAIRALSSYEKRAREEKFA